MFILNKQHKTSQHLSSESKANFSVRMHVSYPRMQVRALTCHSCVAHMGLRAAHEWFAHVARESVNLLMNGSRALVQTCLNTCYIVYPSIIL